MSTVCGVILIGTVIVLYSVRFPYMYHASWKPYIAGFTLPTCGIMTGYIVPKLLRMSNVYARTVAIETGIQNFPLCFGVMALSFSGDVLPKVLLIPLISGLAMVINCTAFVVLYILLKMIRGQKDGKKSRNCELKNEVEKDTDVELISKA